MVDNKIAYVSDSDGVSYPWYGSGTEIASVTGPNDHFTELKIKMNDNFHPSVTWDVPISERDAPHLTKITRDQSFITWLAAVNEKTNKECVRLIFFKITFSNILYELLLKYINNLINTKITNKMLPF